MKFVRKIGAHKIMIALVAGNIKAIIGNATIGIPKPIIPLINPPHNTAKKIIIINKGSLYIKKNQEIYLFLFLICNYIY